MGEASPPEHGVDRPDVEAWRHAQPTGTNRRRQTHASPTLPLQPAILDDTRNSGFTRDHTRRPPSGPPTTTQPPTTRWGRITERLVAAMAQGKRPAPFRTWKLRPGTAMILHPTGCGKVARRHTTTRKPLPANNPEGASPYTRPPSQQRKTTTNNTDNHKNNRALRKQTCGYRDCRRFSDQTYCR